MLAIFLAITKLIPTLLILMGIIEKAFDDKPDSGAEKKAMVLQGAKAAIDGVQSVSTGGQLATWEELEEPVGKVIDGLASLAFPNHAKQDRRDI